MYALLHILGYQHVKMYHVCSTDTNPVSNNTGMVVAYYCTHAGDRL